MKFKNEQIIAEITNYLLCRLYEADFHLVPHHISFDPNRAWKNVDSAIKALYDVQNRMLAELNLRDQKILDVIENRYKEEDKVTQDRPKTELPFKRYKTKPKEVEAFQLSKEFILSRMAGLQGEEEYLGIKLEYCLDVDCRPCLYIKGETDKAKGMVGDYIVRRDDGDFMVMSEEEFQDTYE